MKKFLFGVVLLSSAIFFACGDDGSTSAPTEPTESSSSVIPSNVDIESSGSSCSKAGPNSHQGDESSSSVNVIPGSSSSVIPGSDRESSSSGTSAANSSSSSVAKVSSSCEAVSSSSSYDKRYPLYGFYYHQGRYQTFVDPRDNREYYYLTFEGKDSNNVAKTIHAMVENLNIGEMVPGSGDQSDDTKIERYCYDNDTLNCYQYGGLYQWAEMMQLPSRCNTESCADLIRENHQGICPDGWRLLTFYDLKIIVNSNGNTHGVEGIRSQYGFGGYNTTGFSLIATGTNWLYKFEDVKENTYWHYPEECTKDSDICSIVGFQYPSETSLTSARGLKTQGFPVRCVMVE